MEEHWDRTVQHLASILRNVCRPRWASLRHPWDRTQDQEYNNRETLFKRILPNEIGATSSKFTDSVPKTDKNASRRVPKNVQIIIIYNKH